jgi:biopolymer transport protein ExbB
MKKTLLTILCILACSIVPVFAVEAQNAAAVPAVSQVEDNGLRQSVETLRQRLAELESRRLEASRASEEACARLQSEIASLETELSSARERRAFLETRVNALTAAIARDHSDAREARRLSEQRTQEWGLPEGLSGQALLDAQRVQVRSLRSGLPVEGVVLTPEGVEAPGQLLRIGPFLYFANDAVAGPVFQEKGAALPVVLPLEGAEAATIRARLTSSSDGLSPLPVSFEGKAGFQWQLPARQTLWGHFRQGGVVMIPLGILAWLCLGLVCERCWYYLRNSQERVFSSVCKSGAAGSEARIQSARHALEGSRRGLTLLAVTASVAPLLGLLGTVTGMIHTFEVITQVGTGDARLLAGGISEALITTEAGLLLAIPALLFHAWCLRRNRRLAARLEEACAASQEKRP